MRRWLSVVAMVLTTSSLAPLGRSAEAQDRPEDGVLIYSVSTIALAMNFTFKYRRASLPTGEAINDEQGVIECRCVGFWSARMANPDFSGRETGKVFIKRVPPGTYSIYDFGFGGTLAGVGHSFSSRSAFSIPFTIRPGEATYIGNFARVPSLGTSLEPQLGAAGFFVVSDKFDRDTAIARARDLLPSVIRKEVTDVTQFGHPALRAVEP